MRWCVFDGSVYVSVRRGALLTCLIGISCAAAVSVRFARLPSGFAWVWQCA